MIAAFDGPGRPFLYVLTALAAYGLAVSLERGWLMTIGWRRIPAAVDSALAGGDLAGATQAAGTHPVAPVLSAGAAEASAELAQDAMTVAVVETELRVRRRIGSLGAVANLATMIGLLGTVYGLMLAFAALGDAAAGERAARLSEGIGTAMATTAAGLLVAIPCLAAHAWLEGRAETLMAGVEAAASRLVLALRRKASDA